MGTYDYKQIISDYANDRMTAEMATGHILQHVDKLYEAQMPICELRGKIDTLGKRMNALQTKIDRLIAFVEKFRPKRKQKSRDKQ